MTGAFLNQLLISFNRMQSNSPAVLEPYIHWSKTAHLAENLLLASLGCNRLSQKLTNFARIEMVDETPNTGLAESSQALHEVKPLTNSVVGVVVHALLGGGFAKHVGQKGGVSGLLVGHELNKRLVLRADASLKEIGL